MASAKGSDDVGARFIGSALGAALAETITLPTDVAKVRLQVQNNAAAAVRAPSVQLAGVGGGAVGGAVPGGAALTGVPYTGLVDCLRRTAAEEGPSACFKGLGPALIRQVCYTSMCLVIYEPIRNFYARMGGTGVSQQEGAKPNFGQRLAAGGTSGALAISVFNPAEVLKTQLQTNQTEVGVTMGSVARKVYANDGILGFWAGLQPNIVRTFLVCAAEYGTYDEAKARLQPLTGDGVVTHTCASGIAGFVSACVSTPADVVKTRLMNNAGGEKAYRGMFHAGSSILKEEGFLALYKGFVPICTRKLIWCASFFVSYEKIRAAVNAM